MLRELNINEIDMVSGGAGDGDEIVATGTRRSTSNTVEFRDHWGGGSGLSESALNAFEASLGGSGGGSSDAYLLWLHSGNNVGIASDAPAEATPGDDPTADDSAKDTLAVDLALMLRTGNPYLLGARAVAAFDEWARSHGY